jgi:hypothetical protein
MHPCSGFLKPFCGRNRVRAVSMDEIQIDAASGLAGVVGIHSAGDS